MNMPKKMISNKHCFSLSGHYCKRLWEIHCVFNRNLCDHDAFYFTLDSCSTQGKDKWLGSWDCKKERKRKQDGVIAHEPSLCFPNTSHCRLLFSNKLVLTETQHHPAVLSLLQRQCSVCYLRVGGLVPWFNLALHIVQLDRGGQHRAAGSLCASAGCLTDGVLKTGAACRISSPLQATVGSIFSPPAPMG